MSDLANRALAAHKADTEARALEDEARTIRQRQTALDAILAYAHDVFGISLNPETIELGGGFMGNYKTCVPVNDDVRLRIQYEARNAQVIVSAEACDQLYWNLPPGQTEKSPGGGTYKSDLRHVINGLVELGAFVEKVAKARETWRKSYGVEEQV